MLHFLSNTLNYSKTTLQEQHLKHWKLEQSLTQSAELRQFRLHVDVKNYLHTWRKHNSLNIFSRSVSISLFQEPDAMKI